MEIKRCSSIAIFRHQSACNSVEGEVLFNSVIECVINMKLVILTKMCLNEVYNRVWVGKHMFVVFPIRNVMKKGDVLLP
jgi:hypothetical protein